MRIGLTGGIAAGKSSVSGRMAEDGADVIDYDELVHRLQEPGSAAIPQLTASFGDDILDEHGAVNRAVLAERVFGSDAAPGNVQRLNAIMHPLVYQLARRREREIQHDGRAHHIIVHDIPLLAEVFEDLPFRFDHVVTVEAPCALRIRRMVDTRGMSEAQARARIASQTDDHWREAISDVIIDGSKPIEQMFEDVDSLMQRWWRDVNEE